MKSTQLLSPALFASLILAGCIGGVTTSTPVVSATATAIASATATAVASVTASATATVVASATATVQPTSTPQPSPANNCESNADCPQGTTCTSGAEGVLKKCFNNAEPFPPSSDSFPSPTPSAIASPSLVPSPSATPAVSPSSPTPSVVEVQMTMQRFSFTPSEVRVKQGARVKLTITSTDVTHGISVPDFGVNLNLPPGEAKSVEFVADKPPGTYSFFCSVFCGSGHGSMSGRIVVE